MEAPSELLRSLVGREVTVLAYLEGAPPSPATGTPGEVTETPQAPAPTSTPGSPATPAPVDSFSGRLDDISGLGVAITTVAGTTQFAFFPWHAVLRITLVS
jgi:hypothetical protein